MKRTVTNILTRLKKYAVFLLVLPIITGALSIFLTNGGGEALPRNTVAVADATVDLGEFSDPQLNRPNNAKNLVSSTAFLQKVIDKNNLSIEVGDIQSNMTLENVYDELLIIYLTGDDEETTVATLEGIIDEIMFLSEERYNEWVGLINQSIEDMEDSEVVAEEVASKNELLFNLRQELFNAKKAEITEPVQLANETANVVEKKESSPVKKGIFGVIIGVMLSLFLLVLPEVFRD